MNFVRKIKISKIINQPLEGIDKEILDFILDKISNLTIFKHNDYPTSIFYMNSEGKYILEFEKQKRKNDILYVRYKDFWDVLVSKYSIEYSDIQWNILIFMKFYNIWWNKPTNVG